MRTARPHLTTIAVAAATAVVAATAVAAGPAVAASVVAYAKNAGAVDGKSAVSNNASISDRKGKLVATGAGSGQLPDNIIAKAPNSARLGGTPLSGLATHYLAAYGNWAPVPAGVTFCKTAVFTPTVASVAIVAVSADAAGTAATLFAAQAAVSADGGTTFTRTLPNWYVGSTSAAGGYSALSNSATVPLLKGTHYAFAGTGFATAAMNGDCSVTVQIVPSLPGTSLVIPTAPAPAAAPHRDSGSSRSGVNR